MAQAQTQREGKARESAYVYQVTTGSGALQRTFQVELTRPLGRVPGREQESMLEALRQAIRNTGQTGQELTVRSVKEINPITNAAESRSLPRLQDELRGDVFIAPVVRAR